MGEPMLQRWSPLNGIGGPEMRTDDYHGKWVRHKDHLAAIAEVRVELADCDGAYGRLMVSSREAAQHHEAALAEVERERDEARRFGEDAAAKYNALLKSCNVTTCAFCGEEYPKGTPRTQADELSKHIKTCTKHPMRESERVYRELLHDPDYLHEQLNMLRRTGKGDGHTREADLRDLLKRTAKALNGRGVYGGVFDEVRKAVGDG